MWLNLQIGEMPTTRQDLASQLTSVEWFDLKLSLKSVSLIAADSNYKLGVH